MNKKTIGIVVVIAVILIIVYFLYNPTYKTQTSQTDQVQPIIDTEPTPGATEITINGDEFSFSPSSISVNAGDTVKITFNNVGSISHNFGIPELGIRTKTISAGDSDTIEFVADKTGTFDFDCSISGHKESGMLGSFIVS